MENPPRANHFPRESIDFSTSFCPNRQVIQGQTWLAGKSPINGGVDGFPASHVADCRRVSPFVLVNREPLSPHFLMALLQQTIKTTWKRRCHVPKIIYFHGAFSISTCLSLWNCSLSICVYIYMLILYIYTNIALCLKMRVYTHFTYGFCGDITHHIISLKVIALYSSIIAQWELYIYPIILHLFHIPFFPPCFHGLHTLGIPWWVIEQCSKPCVVPLHSLQF